VTPPTPRDLAGPAGDRLVLLVRHGTTEWSAAGRHTSRTDLPLTEAGIEQAVALRAWVAPLVHRGSAAILCSPRLRAVRTAELAGLVPFTVDPDLVEWDYGAYEGLTTAEIRRQVPGWTVFTHPCPGGETADQVAARCDRVLERVAGLAEATVLVVGHGHALRALAARWLGRPVAAGAELQLSTAAVCVLGHEHGAATLRRWNVANPTEEALP
jgi:broad specificity phosphatase PhoE